MRLKGGKVLIDFTKNGEGLSAEPFIPLTAEEIKAILEKGVVVYVYDNVNEVKFTRQINFNTMDDSTNLLESGFYTDGTNTFDIILDLAGSEIKIGIQ